MLKSMYDSEEKKIEGTLATTDELSNLEPTYIQLTVRKKDRSKSTLKFQFKITFYL